MISVIIPLYNKEPHIAKTLKSVLDQSFQDFEIIVVNDGSTDNGPAIVKSFPDPRIRIVSQSNSGVAAARNKGIFEARGEFVAFLDADDLWMPAYLESLMNLATQFPDCDVFASSYLIREANGNSFSAIIRNLPFDSESGVLSNYFKVAATSNPPIWTSAVMVRHKAITDIGAFPIGVKSGEDLITWARLACRYKIAYVTKALAVFNVDGYSMKEKPKRIPPDYDWVGHELIQLKSNFNPPHINRYISHWHKMRCNIFMRLRKRKKSIKEAAIGLRYYPLNYKLAAFILINLLPSKLQPF